MLRPFFLYAAINVNECKLHQSPVSFTLVAAAVFVAFVGAADVVAAFVVVAAAVFVAFVVATAAAVVVAVCVVAAVVDVYFVA